MSLPLRISCLLILSGFYSFSQSKKVSYTIPTPAVERLEAHTKRIELSSASLVKNIPFRNVGPTIMSGRVVDIEVDPADPTHFFVAYASGGLWETTNEGTSFTPLFDHELVITIGDITVDWINDILYVGSGENNSSRSSYAGFGLYKSVDHGKTWQHLGLQETHHIGRVICHPTNPNTLWVAALGHLYSENEQRGVYKTTDGGKTWEKTLFINKRTGVIELILNPKNPNELMAASWERDRKAWNFEEAGAGSGIYKSTDGGVTWLNVSSGNGFPDTNGTGRIGLCYSPANPTTILAVVDNQDFREKEMPKDSSALTKDQLRVMSISDFLSLQDSTINDFLDNQDFPFEFNAPDLKEQVTNGKIKPVDLVRYLEDANALLFDTPVKGSEVYRSSNGGETWEKTHEGYLESFTFSYGYYFGQVRVSAIDPNKLYIMGVPLLRSLDGGKTWEMTNMDNAHADHHALWVDPNKDGHLINGNDGGVNTSYDNGETWIKCNSVPVGQFYSVNVDMAEPYNIYGGLQDNGVWMGSKNYEYNRSWMQEGQYPYKSIMGGDGMQVAIDTRDNETVYTGFQFGNYFRINTRTGEAIPITPKHKLGEDPYRWNWQSPIQVSIHNQDIVYFGSNRFHRSMNKGESFEPLSGDLTQGGKKGDVAYGTLTTISESSLKFGLIYVGSDDGLVHISKDAGTTWANISEGLPKDLWVSRVAASGHEEGRVYLALNGYRWDNFNALIYVSENQGKTWTRIGLTLPKEPVNVIKEDPTDADILYVGTDRGAYVSLDRGQTFMPFEAGLPAVPVHDLVVHPRDKDLILGTHGRSIFVTSLKPLYQLKSDLEKSLVLYPVEGITFSPSWGNRKEWFWSGFDEPKMRLQAYAAKSDSVLFEISRDSLVLKTWAVYLDAGINFIEYDYTLDKSDEVAKDNGKYYLQAGTYNLTLIQGVNRVPQSFMIEEPKPKMKRKGSED